MHIRRLIAFLLGAWLSGSLLMVVVATHNLGAVDRLMASPPPYAANRIETLGETNARVFLRFQASELNRWYFETWEWTQLALGLLLLATMIAGGATRKSVLVFCGLMLLAVLAMRFVLTPEVTRLGRLIDFIPWDRRSVNRDQFWKYHTAYVVTEGIKDLFGLVLLSSLLRRHGVRPEEEPRERKWVRAR